MGGGQDAARCSRRRTKKGIVHRDIKPENLFPHQRPNLEGAGLSASPTSPTRPRTTRAGTVLGTLAFMPPEQARGDTAAIGVRSDLWSVGATMFTLLSGRLVREHDDIAALLIEAGHVRVPSLREVAPDLPRELTDLVDYALSLDAAARWSSAKTMRQFVRMVTTRA